MQDEAIFEKVLRVENKDVFIDVKSNQNGMYLKISERKDGNRNSILIPASGIKRLAETLQAASLEVKGGSGKAQQGTVSPLRQQSDADIEVKMRSCYIGNLSWECDEEQLKTWCGAAGVVNNAVILRRRQRSLGSGIVEFADAETALNAIATLHEVEMDGRKITVREDKVAKQPASDEEVVATKASRAATAKERKSRIAAMDPSEKVAVPNVIFVQNLSWDLTEDELKVAFCDVGDVEKVELRVSRAGRSLGTATVEFKNPEDVQNAIAKMHGEDLNGRDLVVREFYE